LRYGVTSNCRRRSFILPFDTAISPTFFAAGETRYICIGPSIRSYYIAWIIHAFSSREGSDGVSSRFSSRFPSYLSGPEMYHFPSTDDVADSSTAVLLAAS